MKDDTFECLLFGTTFSVFEFKWSLDYSNRVCVTEKTIRKSLLHKIHESLECLYLGVKKNARFTSKFCRIKVRVTVTNYAEQC